MSRLAAILVSQAAPLGMAAAAFTVAVGLPSSDPDMWWHLASGRWMFEHGELLRVEIFSSTAPGTPYVVGEWLGQIVLYGAYALAGWPGIAVLRALLVAVAAFSLTRVALRSAPPAIALPLVAIALALSKIAWTDRPQLFTLALVPVLLDLLTLARLGRVRALVAVPPLLFVWSDLHGGYALGLVVAAIFALDAVVERRQAGAFVLAAAVAVAVVVANPGAIGILPATAHVGAAPRAIVEEAPPDILTPAGFVFALFVVGSLAAFLLVGAPPLAALLLVPLLWLALSAQRHMVFFVFAAVPFLSEAVWAIWTGRRGRGTASRHRARPAAPDEEVHSLTAAGDVASGQRPRPRRPVLGRLLFGPAGRLVRGAPPLDLAGRVGPGLVVALWVGALASAFGAPSAPDERAYPKGALEALRRSSGVLLHEYDWGGYLIWNAPERPVFVDGRLVPYSGEVLEQHRDALMLRPRWREVLYRHAVAQVLVDPVRPLAGALREDGWRVVAESDTFVLLERPR